MEWDVNKGFWSQDWPNWFLFTSCNYLKHMSLTFLKGHWPVVPPPTHTHTRDQVKDCERKAAAGVPDDLSTVSSRKILLPLVSEHGLLWKGENAP